MAAIDKRTRTLFFTTSPRTPGRMIPEIRLLTDEFSGEVWNTKTQADFMASLVNQDFFIGNKEPSDPAFSARDRITRAPKALGFVDLKPTITLTPAGAEYVSGNRPEEALLRQLLKFQLPSPYHTLSQTSDQDFCVKPYLEILRLIRHFESLTFDEVMLFGLQLTSHRKFDEVASKVESFRQGKAANKGAYSKFFFESCEKEIREIYQPEIAAGTIDTRESGEKTLKRFIDTKKGNMRDYTDACFRYLRATEIVTISQSGHSLSIPEDRIADVDFILKTVSRDPVFVEEEAEYKQYLFNATLPNLLSDDAHALVSKIYALDPAVAIEDLSISELKDKEFTLRSEKKKERYDDQVRHIKSYAEYDSIQKTFEGIQQKAYYDNPLMLEWNTWRAMTMLDGGHIVPNLHLDDEGQPLSTAAGNLADIQCDYGDFNVTVEVTLQSGQKQYDNEGEPVARHVGRLKEATGKATFCLFIAPTISQATIAHFYLLHKVNIQHYGGKAIIVPLELSVFRKMIENSYRVDYVPSSAHIKSIFEESERVAEEAENEVEWFEAMKKYALDWLAVQS